MGIWSGIKHALNSTLGTSEFKPLDKLILDNAKLVASDDVFYAYDGEWEEGGATSDTADNGWYNRTKNYIQFDRTGSVKFKWLQKDTSTTTAAVPCDLQIRVIDGTGVVKGSYSATIQTSKSFSNLYELTAHVNVEPGKKYKVDIFHSSSILPLDRSLVVGATLVFGNGQCTLTT